MDVYVPRPLLNRRNHGHGANSSNNLSVSVLFGNPDVYYYHHLSQGDAPGYLHVGYSNRRPGISRFLPS